MTDPKDLALREAEFLLYQTEDGRTRVEVRFGGETAWLSLKQMVDLFQRDKSVISRHIKNVFEEGELQRESVVAEFATTAADGKTYQVEYFNLDVIISVGYRVKSHRGTQFRIWATQRLREYIVKGFTLDDERLKRAGGGNYFDELLARIRDIRSSEKVFWKKVLEIYATSSDYNPRAEASQLFFKTVQNKMHWAVHGQTAAEVISARADSSQPNMGLTSWTGERPRKADAVVAKNYLNHDELEADGAQPRQEPARPLPRDVGLPQLAVLRRPLRRSPRCSQGRGLLALQALDGEGARRSGQEGRGHPACREQPQSLGERSRHRSTL